MDELLDASYCQTLIYYEGPAAIRYVDCSIVAITNKVDWLLTTMTEAKEQCLRKYWANPQIISLKVAC